uniref:SLAM family member 5 n=1 Tax=Castor canadensis TaxID=51338 RepID=A0A8B7V0B6_CASCN|nr:SLAM family member 5 [Castor canadensis]
MPTCRLGKPKITQSLMTSVNNTCNVTLTCSMEKEEKNVTYSWSPPGEGNVLQILQTSVDQELTYTCTAWNPVSNNSDFISSQQLCADVVMGFGSYLKTFTKSSEPATFDRLWFCLFVIDDVSKNTIYTYVTGSRDILPAESRLYDEIPQQKVLPSNEGPMNTIFPQCRTLTRWGKPSYRSANLPGLQAMKLSSRLVGIALPLETELQPLIVAGALDLDLLFQLLPGDCKTPHPNM